MLRGADVAVDVRRPYLVLVDVGHGLELLALLVGEVCHILQSVRVEQSVRLCYQGRRDESLHRTGPEDENICARERRRHFESPEASFDHHRLGKVDAATSPRHDDSPREVYALRSRIVWRGRLVDVPVV